MNSSSDYLRVKDAPLAAVPRPVVGGGSGGGGIVYTSGGDGTIGTAPTTQQINTLPFIDVTTTEEKTFVFTVTCNWFTTSPQNVSMRIEIQPEAPVHYYPMIATAGASSFQMQSFTVVKTLAAGDWSFRAWLDQSSFFVFTGNIELVVVEYPSSGADSSYWVTP